MALQQQKLVESVKLGALTICHGLADMCVGMLPVLLPVIEPRFGMSIKEGAALLATLNLAANAGQIMTGSLRKHKDTLFFIPLGLLLSSLTFFIGWLPTSDWGRVMVFVMVGLTGLGAAVTHPEGLRAVHRLKAVSSSLSSAVYLNGGVIGSFGGMWLSTFMVEHWGMRSLGWLFLLSLMGIVGIKVLGVRLAVEGAKPVVDADGEDAGKEDVKAEDGGLSFWAVWAMAVPMTFTVVALMWLVPQRLNELDFALAFGGFSCMIMGAGTVLGAMFWAWLADRFSDRGVCVWATLLTVPMLLGYAWSIEHEWAVWFLFFGGACGNGAFALMVHMARHAKGPSLGQRMALMMGGSWGSGALVLWLVISPLAIRYGLQTVLLWSASGYGITGAISFWVWLAGKKKRIMPLV